MEIPKEVLAKVRVPQLSARVHKTECVYSFKTAEDNDGLFVCLNTFLSFSKEYALFFYQKTGNRLFLNIKKVRIELPKDEPESADPPTKKPSLSALLSTLVTEDKKYDYEYTYSAVLLPSFESLPYPSDKLPMLVSNAVEAIISADSVERKADVDALVGDKLKVSKFALDLKQLDNGVKIPPTGFKCAMCDITENLWANLTDGTIGCGRKNWDGTGGNGHALEYYQRTGFPLCVKLGTISADGTADVYSYGEDDMVEDPLLPEHLAHFGINIAMMRKTEKSIAEMELDMNQNFDWSRIQEEGKTLKAQFGPGNTGLVNIGNSCYLASVMQTVFTIPEFRKRYFEQAHHIFKTSQKEPTKCFETQMAKLALGLLSGDYSQPIEEKNEDGTVFQTQKGIAPRMFKNLIGEGHREFSTMKQQDALEFFQYLLEVIKKTERTKVTDGPNPATLFDFKVEEKVTSAGYVSFRHRNDNVLSLGIPVERAVNKDEVKAFEERQSQLKAAGVKEDGEIVRPIVPLSACLETFFGDEEINDFHNSTLGTKTTAVKTSRLSTFPDYLVISLKRFYIGEGWVPKKLDAFVDMPDELDLNAFRAKGPQPGEQLLDASGSAAAPAPPKANEEIVQLLMGMGFPRVRCEKAALNTGNSDPEAASNWLFAHMEDPDIDTPLPTAAPTAAAKPAAAPVNEDDVAMLMSMGFNRNHAVKALNATDNNLERAADWIFSHPEEMDVDSGSKAPEAAKPAGDDLKDGNGKYKLVAFISHMGSSTQSGHYVCHILKDGQWTLFNDSKVALSEDPPKKMAYCYFYKRV